MRALDGNEVKGLLWNWVARRVSMKEHTNFCSPVYEETITLQAGKTWTQTNEMNWSAPQIWSKIWVNKSLIALTASFSWSRRQWMRPKVSRSGNRGGIWGWSDELSFWSSHLNVLPKHLVETAQTCYAHWQPPLGGSFWTQCGCATWQLRIRNAAWLPGEKTQPTACATSLCCGMGL